MESVEFLWKTLLTRLDTVREREDERKVGRDREGREKEREREVRDDQHRCRRRKELSKREGEVRRR